MQLSLMVDYYHTKFQNLIAVLFQSLFAYWPLLYQPFGHLACGRRAPTSATVRQAIKVPVIR